jgi:Flagellin and related hook-associated proteins
MLTPLEAAAEQVRAQQSALGNTSARMDDMISMHENALLLLKTTLSRHQDADLTEVLAEIAKMETSLEATMQVTAQGFVAQSDGLPVIPPFTRTAWWMVPIGRCCSRQVSLAHIAGKDGARIGEFPSLTLKKSTVVLGCVF